MEVFEMKSEFLTELVIIDVGNGYFLLNEPLIYNSKKLNQQIIVPSGFLTDLASIPRLLWSIFPPFGKYSRAAVVHDYILSKKYYYNLTKKEYDDIFLEAMKAYNVNVFTRNIFYYSLRLFGT
jgi:hypothetical protein